MKLDWAVYPTLSSSSERHSFSRVITGEDSTKSAMGGLLIKFLFFWDKKTFQGSVEVHWVSLVAQQYRICLQCRRCGFHPWVRKFPWRRAWQPTPVFLPGESHGRRAWQAAVNRVTQSRTRLMQLSTRSTILCVRACYMCIYAHYSEHRVIQILNSRILWHRTLILPTPKYSFRNFDITAPSSKVMLQLHSPSYHDLVTLTPLPPRK